MSESFQIVDAHMCLPTDPFSYRILTESSTFKYLIASSPPPGATFPDIYGQHLAFQTVGLGDWTVGRLGLADDGRFVLRSTENARLPDVGMPWHPSKIDFLDLPTRLPGSNTNDELQCYNQLAARIVPTPGQLGDCRAAIAFWLWQPPLSVGLGPESEMYAVIHGHDIGPKFLAHITENHNRIIGFVVERLQARIAAVSDLGKCKAVLTKLHGLGIAHGGLTRQSFLVDDGLDRAYLHNFAASYPTTDQGVLEAELASLEDILRQTVETSGPGGERLSIMAGRFGA